MGPVRRKTHGVARAGGGSASLAREGAKRKTFARHEPSGACCGTAVPHPRASNTLRLTHAALAAESPRERARRHQTRRSKFGHPRGARWRERSCAAAPPRARCTSVVWFLESTEGVRLVIVADWMGGKVRGGSEGVGCVCVLRALSGADEQQQLNHVNRVSVNLSIARNTPPALPCPCCDCAPLVRRLPEQSAAGCVVCGRRASHCAARAAGTPGSRMVSLWGIRIVTL